MGVDGALAGRERKAGNPAGRKSRTGVKRAPPNPLASFFQPTRRSCPSLPSCPRAPDQAPARRLLVAAPFLAFQHADVRSPERASDFRVRHADVIAAAD